MAIVHVSTATEFWNALNTSGDEVYIDNDIDCNSISITSSKEVKAALVDGQGHTLYNLAMTGSADMFSFGTLFGTHTIQNVNLANVLQPYDYAVFRNTNSNPHIDLINVQIQGLCRKIIRGQRFTVQKCTFHTTGTTTIIAGSATLNASLCYFDCDTIPSTSTRFSYCNLTDCYVKGDFDATGYIATYVYFSNCNLTRVIVNNDFINTTGIEFKLISGGTCEDVLYNSSKMGDMTYTTVTGATGLTDTQLKTPADVIATGFPLVV